MPLAVIAHEGLLLRTAENSLVNSTGQLQPCTGCFHSERCPKRKSIVLRKTGQSRISEGFYGYRWPHLVSKPRYQMVGLSSKGISRNDARLVGQKQEVPAADSPEFNGVAGEYMGLISTVFHAAIARAKEFSIPTLNSRLPNRCGQNCPVGVAIPSVVLSAVFSKLGLENHC